MMGMQCKNCENEITDYKNMAQIVDLKSGFTYTYCGNCAKEVRAKLDSRDSAIK